MASSAIRAMGYSVESAYTSRPLYEPHSGHTRCGSMAELHCGQVVVVGAATFHIALRRRVRERDIFFFGTATGSSFHQSESRSLRPANGELSATSCPGHGAVFKSAPHDAQIPLQSARQIGANGSASTTSSRMGPSVSIQCS